MYTAFFRCYQVLKVWKLHSGILLPNPCVPGTCKEPQCSGREGLTLLLSLERQCSFWYPCRILETNRALDKMMGQCLYFLCQMPVLHKGRPVWPSASWSGPRTSLILNKGPGTGVCRGRSVCRSSPRHGVAWKVSKILYFAENVFIWNKLYHLDKNTKKNQTGIFKYMRAHQKIFSTPQFSSFFFFLEILINLFDSNQNND